MFHALKDLVHSLAAERGLSAPPWLVDTVQITVLVLLAGAANWVAKKIILRSVVALVRRTHAKWDDAFLRTGVFSRLSHIAPALVVDAFGADVFGHSPESLAAVGSAVNIYLIAIGAAVICAFLNALTEIAHVGPAAGRVPVKGFAQAGKLLTFLVAGIFILSNLLGKSPVYLLSGLGALTAVLLLVFRDALLGFTAGIMLSANNMVRIGDWIEMPKAGADGDVVDVTLTTVKVQNWDKTITAIPAYSLISESFKNWRGMQESGGRRIKRALRIDMHSARFADEAMIEHWRRIAILRPYLEGKLAELAAANLESADADLSVLANGRRLTNLGTFRAYCVAYLRRHPRIHQEMTFLVRQLEPDEHGIPLELYVFTNDTAWANYEAIQADIFDHLLAVLPEFGLRTYQAPSGRDIEMLAGTPRFHATGARAPAPASDGVQAPPARSGP